MKPRKLKVFIKWQFNQMSGWVKERNEFYEKLVIEDAWWAALPTIMIGIVVAIPLTVVSSMFGVSVQLFVWLWAMVGLLLIGNYVRILLKQQYKKFLKETGAKE
jgi:hypothetical protein